MVEVDLFNGGEVMLPTLRRTALSIAALVQPAPISAASSNGRAPQRALLCRSIVTNSVEQFIDDASQRATQWVIAEDAQKTLDLGDGHLCAEDCHYDQSRTGKPQAQYIDKGEGKDFLRVPTSFLYKQHIRSKCS